MNRNRQTTVLSLCSFVISNALLAQLEPTAIAPMMDYREAHAMVPFASGMLVIGGFDGGTTTAACEWYDPEMDVWTSVASLPEPRQDATAHSVAEGVFVIGGWDGGATNLDDILRYDAELDEWTAVATMGQGRSGHSSVVTVEGIFICGGYNGSMDLAECDLFDLNSYEVTPMPGMDVARSSFAMMHFTHAGIPKTLVAGGFNPDAGFQLSSCELFDGDTWVAAADLPWGVDNLAGAVMGDGMTPVVTGGRVFNGSANLFEGMAQGAVYDAGSDDWVAFDLAGPHSYHGMAIGPESRVWISGGANESGSGVSTTFTFAEQGQLDGGSPASPFASVAELEECAGRFRAAVATDGNGLVVTGGDESLIGTGYRVDWGSSTDVFDAPRPADLSVFPNPCVGRSVLLGVDASQFWRVFDGNGVLVLEGQGSGLELSGLANGRYTVIASDGRTASLMLLR